MIFVRLSYYNSVMLSFSVGDLINKKEGARKDFVFDEPFSCGSKDFKLISNVSGEVQLLKLPHEINVQVRNFHVTTQGTCSRCLQPFECKLEVPVLEREFIIDLSDPDIVEYEDVYRVNLHTNRIELDDVVREEILLHFPPIPVCSSSCKGLCDKCGTNLNERDCNCRHESDGATKPFKFLTP